MTHIVDSKVRAKSETEDPASRLLTAGAGIQTADNGAGGAAVVALYAAHEWTYADATARAAATGFVAGDVGKLAFQRSDGTYWTLADDDPATWTAYDLTAGNAGETAAIDSDAANIPAVNAVEQAEVPATPAAGHRKIYAKADGWYDLDDAGTETKLGADAALALDDLTDVIIATPAVGDTLTWNGSAWVNGASSSSTHWEPLTNSNPAAPELMFDENGDVLMVEVSN